MSYRSLEIWQMARELVIEIHAISISKLPKFEIYEEGSQIRRSVKSVKSNIVEGYGRRKYKQDYIRFLTFAHASCDETIDHWETLYETGSFTDKATYDQIHDRLNQLGGKINRFIQSVLIQHNVVREESAEYLVNTEE